jgi:MFS family permease
MTRQRLPFIALCVTMLISVTGNALANLALPWFVLQSTGSAAQTGITAFVGLVPIILGAFFGGVITDRIGYKPMSLIADLMSGLMVLMIPLLYQSVGLEFWQLLLLVFLSNLFDAPGATARRAMLPELAAQAGLSIERASAILDGISRATVMLGGPLAGILITAFGAVNVLILNALSFGISILGVALFIPATLLGDSTMPLEDEAKEKLWQSIWAGLGFIRRDTLLLILILSVTAMNMIDAAHSAVVLPYYAREVFGAAQGAAQLGILIGTFGAAAVFSSILMGAFGSRFPRRLLFGASFTILSLRFFVFAAYPPFLLLILTSIISGLVVGPLNPIISTIMYERIPKAMRARVMGFASAGFQVAMPLGPLIAGFLLEAIDLRSTLFLLGLSYLLIALTMLFGPGLRAMDVKAVAGEAVQ